ncbi:MAG TPA: AMP-binding protein [Acidimicrobiia bacterium]
MLDEPLMRAAASSPDALALADETRSWTFAQLGARTDALARGIAGVSEPGDRIAVLAQNRGEYVECYYGIPRAGRVLVPLHPRLHEQEWRSILLRSGAAAIVGEHALLERLGDTGLPVFDLDGEAGAPYESLITDQGETGPPLGRNDENVAFLIGTSGTTGAPKLAMLTHSSFAAAVDATLAARPVADDDVLLTPFPLCHVAGYNVFVYHVRARPIVLMRQFDPLGLVQLVVRYGVTALSLAPTMIAMLLDADVDHDALARIRSIGYGASPIPATVLRSGVARWACDFSQGYGMTELSGNAVFLGPDEHRAAAAGDERLLRAAGYPAHGVELRIAEDDGEVLVRAPQVMAGYWDEPQASGATLHEGWLHTGDVGKLDDDGLLTLIDRTKDVIVTGGENVASREVEDVLHEHEAVRDVAVVGVPDGTWGERVTAVVVPWPGKHVTADDLVELARSQLAGFKAPREVVFVDELPRNATGKVLKQALRERLAHREP